MSITEPGVYKIPEADYHADPCPLPSLSSSGARKIMSECPALYWYDRNNPREKTNALDVGSLAHAMILEGDEWRNRFAVLPEDHNARTNEGKAIQAGYEESGMTVIKHADFEKVAAMADAIRAHKLASAVFSNGRPEMTLAWQDKQFGIWKRVLLDWLPNDGGRIFADMKTTISANPEALRKTMYNYGYHQQAAWYLDGIKALGLTDRPSFIFVFQEKQPPYQVVIAQPDETALMWARTLNEKASETFARCLDAGHWPGYSDDVEVLSLPGFAEHEYQRRDGMSAFDIAAEYQSPKGEAA